MMSLALVMIAVAVLPAALAATATCTGNWTAVDGVPDKCFRPIYYWDVYWDYTWPSGYGSDWGHQGFDWDASNEVCLSRTSGRGRLFTPSSLKELRTVEDGLSSFFNRSGGGYYSRYGWYFTGYKMASYEALIPDSSNPGFNKKIQVYLPISDTGYVMPVDMWAPGTQWDSTNECINGFQNGFVTDYPCFYTDYPVLDMFTILCEVPSEN